jgi:hypothetical protein
MARLIILDLFSRFVLVIIMMYGYNLNWFIDQKYAWLVIILSSILPIYTFIKALPKLEKNIILRFFIISFILLFNLIWVYGSGIVIGLIYCESCYF